MKKILLLVLVTVMTISCQSQTNPKIKILPVAEYKQEISKEAVQLVDVRTPGEFADGAIPNAENINVNDASFEEKIQKLDKTKPVYVYCRSGARSQVAAKKMIEMGFEEVIDLDGGYLNWNKN
jgi:rhodanese-related sulfurtransferase